MEYKQAYEEWGARGHDMNNDLFFIEINGEPALLRASSVQLVCASPQGTTLVYLDGGQVVETPMSLGFVMKSVRQFEEAR